MSPYKSKKQRSWMHVNKPEIAKKWDKETGGKVKPEKPKQRKKGK